MSYSPSVAAALAADPKLARRTLAARDGAPIPAPGSPEARAIVAEVFGSAAVPAQVPKPPGSPTYREDMERGLAERANAMALRARGISLRDGAPDAIEDALLRVDAVEERAARYREATGKAKRLGSEGTEALTLKVEPALRDEIDVLAAQRGETRSATARFLIHCGLILADERRKRYEAFMLAQPVAQAEPERYLDPASPSLARAQAERDPFAGAPAAVQAVAGELLPPEEKPTTFAFRTFPLGETIDQVEDAMSLPAPNGTRVNVTAPHELDDTDVTDVTDIAPMNPRGPAQQWY